MGGVADGVGVWRPGVELGVMTVSPIWRGCCCCCGRWRNWPVLEGGERLAVPYPAPTPPLSATHLAKEAQHALPDTEVKFSSQQIDCICDSLQQRKDMATLGKHC